MWKVGGLCCSRTAGLGPALPAPLIVLAPGLNTDFIALLYLGEHLASRGYGLAALNFPATSANRVSATIQGLAAIPAPNAWFYQPVDVSLLIDQVAQRWPKQIDTRRVGALGQSQGGYTVLALAGARLDWVHLDRSCAVINDPGEVEFNPAILWQCKAPGKVVKRSDFTDPRIKAVIAVNPVSTHFHEGFDTGHEGSRHDCIGYQGYFRSAHFPAAHSLQQCEQQRQSTGRIR